MEHLSLDFYCAAARLAIEVDGEVHDRGDQPAWDVARDRWLAEHGIETMRVPAALVFRDVGNVIEGIVAVATARLPLHHRPTAGGPPPQDELGEDKDDG